MSTEAVTFYINEGQVIAEGCPELEGRKGRLEGDDIAFFYETDREKYDLHIVNIRTGKMRKLSTSSGILLADDKDIDYDAINKEFEHGTSNAHYKAIRYERLYSYDGFKDGLCAIKWMLYPDGEYFRDEDGFGMKDNYKEVVYAIMDTELNIIEPFRPVADIKAYLNEIREKKHQQIKKTNDMKTTIFNLIILDESGSMEGIRNQTIAGCNEVINTIKHAQKEHADTQKHFISIYAFQSGGNPSRYLIKNEAPDSTNHITETDYAPCGCTPLYDAIGVTVNSLREVVKTHEHAIGSVTIITDGMENSSKEYNHHQVSNMIKELKEMGWNFNFIGANIDVMKVSRSMNIDNALAFEHTQVGTTIMFEKDRRSRERWFDRIDDYIANISAETDDAEFKSRMRETSEGYFDED